MKIVEDFLEFRRRMGCECLTMPNGRWIFENGALSDGLLGHDDPPVNTFMLLTNQRCFLEAKVKKLKKDFDNIKSQELEQAALHRKYANLPPPNPDAARVLREIAELIANLREQVAEIDVKLGPKPVDTIAARKEETRSVQLAEAAATVSEINNIQI